MLVRMSSNKSNYNNTYIFTARKKQNGIKVQKKLFVTQLIESRDRYKLPQATFMLTKLELHLN